MSSKNTAISKEGAARHVVLDRLNAVFQDVFDDPGICISGETSASDIGDWDSLQHIILVLAVEREFGITLSASEAADLPNVGKMVDLIIAAQS